MSSDVALPEYAAELTAFHRAHRAELRQIIRDLDVPQHAAVLDVACGDGVYGQWIAEKVGPHGAVIGADRSAAYLEAANRQRTVQQQFVAADIQLLPFDCEVFDVAWCAQSLVSLPEPVAVLSEVRRVLRPGGRAVVMENDSLHELMLPWPEDLELAIRAAQWRAYQTTKQRPEKRYIGRRLSSVMRRAGLQPISRKTYATDRLAPLNDDETMFLTNHLGALRDTVRQYLPRTQLSSFDRLTHPDSDQFMLAWPDFEMTWIDVVCVGKKLKN
jgi:ubiquinone/menaquinone biosynthesis C-methylase UbiE